jgi:hypothetical protein
VAETVPVQVTGPLSPDAVALNENVPSEPIVIVLLPENAPEKLTVQLPAYGFAPGPGPDVSSLHPAHIATTRHNANAPNIIFLMCSSIEEMTIAYFKRTSRLVSVNVPAVMR